MTGDTNMASMFRGTHQSLYNHTDTLWIPTQVSVTPTDALTDFATLTDTPLDSPSTLFSDPHPPTIGATQKWPTF